MTRAELESIEKLGRSVPQKGVVVEAGSLYGLSSYVWATSIPENSTLYCIDPWVRMPWIVELVETKIPGCPPFSFEAFRHYTRACKNIVPIRGYSPQVAIGWNKPVDIFFDDSLHHNPFFRNNLRFWFEKMKRGGIMCGHDYSDLWPDVRLEVNQLAREVGAKVFTTEAFWWFELPK